MAVLVQRPLKGSRISSFYPVKALPPLSSLDSAFQLQEYISLLIRLDVHDVDRIVSIPGKNSGDVQDNGDSKAEEKEAEKDGVGSVNVDEACWVYEQLRRLAQDLSHPLITMLQQECTRSTCPEMKAGEWLYLCVAHGNEGAMEQCCAIDYILHTLDSATALLNSPRAFPSRLSVPPASHRHFSSLARRLGRIFAHAYFHHREAFEQAEAESSLYARFLALTSKFDLVPAEFLVIPPRLTAMSDDERGGRGDHVEPPRLLAASLAPRGDLGHEGRWPRQDAEGRDRGMSPPGSAALQRTESPRKFGRNRTDTMVYSEAFSVAEELAKSDLSEVDIDREIAAERAAADVEEEDYRVVPPPPPPPPSFASADPIVTPEAHPEEQVTEEVKSESPESEHPPEPEAELKPETEYVWNHDPIVVKRSAAEVPEVSDRNDEQEDVEEKEEKEEKAEKEEPAAEVLESQVEAETKELEADAPAPAPAEEEAAPAAEEPTVEAEAAEEEAALKTEEPVEVELAPVVIDAKEDVPADMSEPVVSTEEAASQPEKADEHAEEDEDEDDEEEEEEDGEDEEDGEEEEASKEEPESKEVAPTEQTDHSTEPQTAAAAEDS